MRGISSKNRTAKTVFSGVEPRTLSPINQKRFAWSTTKSKRQQCRVVTTVSPAGIEIGTVLAVYCSNKPVWIEVNRRVANLFALHSPGLKNVWPSRLSDDHHVSGF